AKKIDGKEVVMFGMGGIKGAGDVGINAILNGCGNAPFKDLPDFISRIDGRKVNKRVIESLTKAGPFDSFGYTRKSLLN
ncbi:hypothetical protein ACN09X_11580, partial [Aliarcobacter butzleri]|uniref:helix-hairpin-helix domain-containing protein n=1 Tax=Aliarcobacter butzleri TaxID=28197 RepID=UPI003AE98480